MRFAGLVGLLGFIGFGFICAGRGMLRAHGVAPRLVGALRKKPRLIASYLLR